MVITFADKKKDSIALSLIIACFVVVSVRDSCNPHCHNLFLRYYSSTNLSAKSGRSFSNFLRLPIGMTICSRDGHILKIFAG